MNICKWSVCSLGISRKAGQMVLLLFGGVALMWAGFALPVFIGNDPLAPSRGWSACNMDYAKYQLITWAIDKGKDYCMTGKGKGVTQLSVDEHAKVMQWAKEGMTPDEVFQKAVKEFKLSVN